jgi:carbonic anhydrase/acetyltransferase-like protein (isoleucine patch superfamily)
MARDGGDMVFQVPLRAFLSIENWVHIFMANSPFGVFALGRAHEAVMERGRLAQFSRWKGEDWQALRKKIGFVLTTLKDKYNPLGAQWRNSFFANSQMVKIGKNCSIDPTAIIHGPTIIGDNVTIGAGTVITNSLIGSNVNIMQGCQVMLSVVSDRCYLPFNAALFMTTLMENSMVAQNSTLQLCVVGRNTFIGANNVFTDFDLLGNPIQTFHNGKLQEVGLPVIGSAVGHNVKIGSGFVVYPARMIGSNTTLLFVHEDNLVRKNVSGLDPNDVDEETGDPRRIVYRWPNIYQPDSPGSLTVPPQASTSVDDRTPSRPITARHSSARLLR